MPESFIRYCVSAFQRVCTSSADSINFSYPSLIYYSMLECIATLLLYKSKYALIQSSLVTKIGELERSAIFVCEIETNES